VLKYFNIGLHNANCQIKVNSLSQLLTQY